jgi:hypothetical protein
VLSLLGGLLFRPREVIEQIIRHPDRDQASRVSSIVIVLIMINSAFLTVLDPKMAEDLKVIGNVKWVLILILPPLIFFLQRFLQVLLIRLGLLLFASKKLPQDKAERREKFALVKMTYAYTVFPSFVFALLSLPIQSPILNFVFFTAGIAYTLYLTMQVLKNIFGVSSAVALFAPLVMQFLFGVFVSVILLVGMLVLAVLQTTSA